MSWPRIHGTERVRDQTVPLAGRDRVVRNRHSHIDDQRDDARPSRADGFGQAPHPGGAERQRAQHQDFGEDPHRAQEQQPETTDDAQTGRIGLDRAQAHGLVAGGPRADQAGGTVAQHRYVTDRGDVAEDQVATTYDQHQRDEQPGDEGGACLR